MRHVQRSSTTSVNQVRGDQLSMTKGNGLLHTLVITSQETHLFCDPSYETLQSCGLPVIIQRLSAVVLPHESNFVPSINPDDPVFKTLMISWSWCKTSFCEISLLSNFQKGLRVLNLSPPHKPYVLVGRRPLDVGLHEVLTRFWLTLVTSIPWWCSSPPGHLPLSIAELLP